MPGELMGHVFREEHAAIVAELLDDEPNDVEIGDLWDSLGSAAKTVARQAKRAIRSKITKVTVGGLAIAFPAVGVPAAGALLAADRAVRIAEGTRPEKRRGQRAKVLRAVEASVRAAKAGDPDAQRAVQFMALSKAIRANQARATASAELGWFVSDRGTVRRGRFGEVR